MIPPVFAADEWHARGFLRICRPPRLRRTLPSAGKTRPDSLARQLLLGGSAKDVAGVRMNHCCGASFVLPKTMHPCRSTAAAPVWARDHFQIVAVRVGKIDPASAVIMIDLARAATPRVGPVLETLLTDAAEDGIEISRGNQESIMLWLDRSIGGREIQRHSVVEFDHLEGTEPDWRRQP